MKILGFSNDMELNEWSKWAEVGYSIQYRRSIAVHQVQWSAVLEQVLSAPYVLAKNLDYPTYKDTCNIRL